MQKLYADLYSDIKNKHNKNHVFSDGYDLVLCGRIESAQTDKRYLLVALRAIITNSSFASGLLSEKSLPSKAENIT